VPLYHVKAGRSVYFTPVSDLVSALAKAEREGTLREKIRFFCCFSVLIVEMPNLLLVNPNTSGLVTTILAREARVVAGQRAEILAVSPSFGSASIECVAEIAFAAHGVLVAAHPDYDGRGHCRLRTSSRPRINKRW
jgi:hypothetical protein